MAELSARGPGLGEGVEDGNDLTQRTDRAGRVRSRPRGRLDEVVDAEVVLSRVLEDGEALAANVLLRGRDPQIGDGLHDLSMECVFGYFI